MGVWIEIPIGCFFSCYSGVTPLVGVWIEIKEICHCSHWNAVTPLVGVWIEIIGNLYNIGWNSVTPLVGVWIEILREQKKKCLFLSLPLWECGLKYRCKHQAARSAASLPLWECGLKYRRGKSDHGAGRHSPCGSVD